MSILTKLTPKLHVREYPNGTKYYFFWCPACQSCHLGETPRWGFNGNVDAPTFTPSIKLTAPPSNFCCHFHLVDGKINYCGDCSHDMRGTTVDMVEIPDDYST